ncbi:DUF4192 family protein [uncultured Aeromicrobium sp.]|uniref:DUF4192 family protein n=1 Tax=uncultured Aeromicrobium sp. TaxID=337820 RepID=UPI0025EDBF8F|nr:DUF4192 family protein [uncultured Aeromicrobium sp.]
MDVIKATSAADFLGLVPALVGCTPSCSIVAIPFAGSRTIGAARFDLNPTLDPATLASAIVGVICRVPAADGFAVVVYTDEAGEASQGLVSALLACADKPRSTDGASAEWARVDRRCVMSRGQG